MRITAHSLAAPFMALALCATAQAATVLKTVSRELDGSKESLTTVYAEGGKMRVETGGANDVVAVVFRDDALYSFNAKDRTYYVMDRASMKKMADTVNPALKQLQEQMAKMSPEQRAQMEKMMGGGKLPGMGGKEPVEEIRQTSRTSKAAGYSCTYAEMWQDGVLVSEACVAPMASIKGGQELADASVKIAALMSDMLKEIDAPWLKQIANRQVENFAKLGGVPVIGRTFSGGKPVREATLQSIASTAAPAGAFEVPAGYTRKEMMPQR